MSPRDFSRMRWIGLAGGVLFGLLLGWARLTDFTVIHKMLRLEEAYVFLFMASAVATGFVGLRLLRALGARTLDGAAVSFRPERPNGQQLVGAAIFGLGWSIACACPGPALAEIGRGQLAGLFISVGLLGGVELAGRLTAWRARRRAPASSSAAVL